jgi:hypothetical protein
VRLGDQNLASKTEHTLILGIQAVSLHPKYDLKTAYFDIAVVETEAVTFTNYIRPVCLPRLITKGCSCLFIFFHFGI